MGGERTQARALQWASWQQRWAQSSAEGHRPLPRESEEEPGGLALLACNPQAEHSGIPEKGKEQSTASGDLSQVLSYRQTHLKERSICRGLGED